MLFTSLILGLLSGLILGLFGGGGALFIIPVLTYVFHYSLKTAIASSLFLVTIGSLPSILLYLKKKEIDLHSAFKLGIGGALGAYIAGIISQNIEARILFYILILLMGISSYFMFKKSDTSSTKIKPSTLQVFFIGSFIGFLTGLVGVGGGFMLVPVLILFCQVKPREAIATSLLVIFSNSFFGLVNNLSLVPYLNLRFQLLAAFTIIGSLFGFILNNRFSQETLKKAFGYFLIFLIVLMLTKPII